MVNLRPHRLTAETQARIAAAVADLERRSAAELVVVVAQRAAGYAAYPGLWAAGAALLAGWIAVLIDHALPAVHLLALQGVVLILAGTLFYLTPLGMMLVPPKVRQARAAMLARLEFSALVNERTRNKNGVLLFVSLAEHYIEIIADDAVAAAVSSDRWQQLVSQFQDKARRGPLGDGLISLIAGCAGLLETHFPPRPGGTNELPDTVREI